MDASLTYMLDTNVFNRLLDGAVPLEKLTGRVVVYATHVQRDEINNTTNPQRRAALAQIFNNVIAESQPTDSAVVDVSRVGEARIGGERVVATESAVYDVSRYGLAEYGGDDDLYSALKGRLDSMNGSKPNNVHDALIAETSIKGGHVLVTEDADLSTVTKEYGGQCLSVAELLSHPSEKAAA